MSFRKDKIFDVLYVLDFMRKTNSSVSFPHDIRKIRMEAIKAVAETEFRKGRYKNEDSASKTIMDACRRRLKPDVFTIAQFDRLANNWLSQNSSELRDIVLKHSKLSYQKSVVVNFFNGKPMPD